MACKQCGACCKFLCFTIFGVSDRLNEKEYYEAHGCEVKGNKIFIPMRCPHLTEDNKCDIHDSNPEICKNFVGVGSDIYPILKECKWNE